MLPTLWFRNTWSWDPGAERPRLEQADGTAWMAYYALGMLIIALLPPRRTRSTWTWSSSSPRSSRGSRGRSTVRASSTRTTRSSTTGSSPHRARSRKSRCRRSRGLLPVLPAVAVPMRYVRRVLALGKRFERMRDAYRETGGRGFGRVRTPDGEEAALVSVIEPEQLRATLREFFDEDGFLSPHGLRSVSKRYENNPYVLDGVPGAWIDYEPAESTTTMFGGNSNWRGPVWLPVNRHEGRTRRQLQAGVPDRLGATAHLRGDRPGSRRPDRRDLAPGSGWSPAPLRRGREAADRPGVEGQSPLQRVLPRRQRCRPRRRAPDRLDGARGRPDPRPAVGRARTRTHGAPRAPLTSKGSPR